MEENINIAKILENAPKGLKLYSSLCGECQYDRLVESLGGYDIYVTTLEDDYTYCFNQDGIYMDGGECLLFPSKEYRSWDNWQKILFKKGDIVSAQSVVNYKKNVYLYGGYDKDKNEFIGYMNDGHLDYLNLNQCIYATPEEKEKFFKELEDNGYRWDENKEQLAEIKCSNPEYDNTLKNNTFYHIPAETEVEVTPDGCYKCVLKTEKRGLNSVLVTI